MTTELTRPSEVHGSRPQVRGKFLYRGTQKLYIRGATYGTFEPGLDGSGYPGPETVERDFAQMAANGINAVRTYTLPPRRLLDAAERHGLLVMVGLAWEQHVAFLRKSRRADDIERRVREGIRACAGHPAVLAYSIGNEIPAPVVRWHGKRRVERFLERLYRAAKSEDPDGLVTYVNYPTTEYLELPSLDFVCFNVYLEEQERLEAYLGRLHNLAGDRPLLMAEIGLDSRRNGEGAQGDSLSWQIRSAFATGCAGSFVFAWTDEWYVTHLGADGRGQGGSEISDWDFGLTTRDRRPKPSLSAVREAYAEIPFPRDADSPRISVIVCSYNGERTLPETCDRLCRLEYSDYEVVLVDDGSTDATPEIARRYGFRVISTENRGLSAARNSGMTAATGEIVAYLDDDAYPDPHWLTYLAAAYRAGDYVGVGGPNVPPDDEGTIAACVAHAPGNPIHVLLSDCEAEHIPGCNSSFRKSALEAVGGFDPRFRVAGDDVDVCWRLRKAGGTLGFSPTGLVWHHRRASLRAFWRQQRGYGKAEALLERKWPEKYNAAGHVAWGGRIYGGGLVRSLRRRQRIYHGVWGNAPFQSLYEREPGALPVLPAMPEWYLLIVLLFGLSVLGLGWRPLLAAIPLLVLAMACSAASAVSAALSSPCLRPGGGLLRAWRDRGLIALLFLLQPLARLTGRLRLGLAPWRLAPRTRLVPPLPRDRAIWSEQPRSQEQRLAGIESSIRAEGATALRGREFDRWDLRVRNGGLASTSLRMAIEEHGAGRQMTRIRVRPRPSWAALASFALTASLAILAAIGGGPGAAAVLAAGALVVAAAVLLEAAAETGLVLAAIDAHAEVAEQLPEPEVLSAAGEEAPA